MNQINIQHGFTLAPETNLFTLVQDLKDILDPVHRQVQIKEIAIHAARILDTADLNEEGRPASVIFDAFQAQKEHVSLIQSGEHQCPAAMITISLAEGLSREALYMVVNAGYPEQIEALIESNIGDYTPYWNEETHGRRPVGTTSAAWESRGAAWASSLRMVDGEPTSTVISLQIGDPVPDIDLISDTDAVLAAIPTHEERVSLVLNNLGNGTFSSPEEMMSFMSTMPGRLEHINSHLKPITMTDLNGVEAA